MIILLSYFHPLFQLRRKFTLSFTAVPSEDWWHRIRFHDNSSSHFWDASLSVEKVRKCLIFPISLNRMQCRIINNNKIYWIFEGILSWWFLISYFPNQMQRQITRTATLTITTKTRRITNCSPGVELNLLNTTIACCWNRIK